MISSTVSFDKREHVSETTSLRAENAFSFAEEETGVARRCIAIPYIAGCFLFRLYPNFMTEKSSCGNIISFLFDGPDIDLIVNRYFIQIDLGT